jgi:hypothetical protein
LKILTAKVLMNFNGKIIFAIFKVLKLREKLKND